MDILCALIYFSFIEEKEETSLKYIYFPTLYCDLLSFFDIFDLEIPKPYQKSLR